MDEQERITLAVVVSGTPVAENPQVMPPGELVSVRVTVPENPLVAFRVILEKGAELTSPVAVEGLGLILKLAIEAETVTDMLVEFLIAPFVPAVPVTVTTKLPVVVPDAVQVTLEVPPAVRVNDAGQVTVKGPPVIVFVNVTFPTKPDVPDGRLAPVMAKLADVPALNETLEADEEMLTPVI